MVCNRMVDDVYLKYIQCCALHYRFYTNNVLFICKLIDTDIYSICNLDQDGSAYMLLKCSYVIELWNQVCQWSTDVGGTDYYLILSDNRKIAGDMEKNQVFNIIIQAAKKTFTIVKWKVK